MNKILKDLMESQFRPEILLDMDGVAVNTNKSFLEANGFHENYPVTKWEIAEECGMSAKEFWGNIAKTENLWRDAVEHTWFPELYDSLKHRGNVTFCTSPTLEAVCAKEKIEWLQDRFGKDFRNFIITPQKHLFAKPGSMLIDDNMDNCRIFEEHGGKAILFPQPWNVMWDEGKPPTGGQRIEYVLRTLDGYIASMSNQECNFGD